MKIRRKYILPRVLCKGYSILSYLRLMLKQKYLLVISGPTASGKTQISLDLARAYQTVILSADSRQFYREMNIGTAKPSSAELAQAPHYFINSQHINEPYSVGDFVSEALALLEMLYKQHDVVLLVGGSGLFIQGLCEGLDEFPDIPQAVRDELNQLYAEQGIEALQEALQVADPAYYATVDRQNPQRLIRALEVCRVAKRPFSAFRKQQRVARSFQPIYLQMQWPRKKLYERINLRVDQMMEAGLLEEVKSLVAFQHLNALQTVGYQELFPYLKGDYSLEEAVELLKRNTRRYAKRQMTWNRRKGHWKHFHPSEGVLLKSYLSWAIATGHSLYWKKAPMESTSATLGIKGPGFWEEILTIRSKKKIIHISLASQSPIDPLLQQFSLHEIILRLQPEQLQADLPSSWQKTWETIYKRWEIINH